MIMPLCPFGLTAIAISSAIVPLPNYVCVDSSPKPETRMESAYQAYVQCVKVVADKRLVSGNIDMNAMQECARVLPKEQP